MNAWSTNCPSKSAGRPPGSSWACTARASARWRVTPEQARRRIGVATGHSLTQAAAPLATVANGAHGPDWRAIERLVSDYKPAVLVVGNPYNADGTPGAMSAAAGDFAAALAQRMGLPVERVDERWSSQEASAELKERRAAGTRRRRVQRADIDSLAAAIILERWLRGE